MDHEHILALVEAVHGAHGDAIHGFAANAAFVDDESQFSTPNTLERATLAKKGCTVHSTIRIRGMSRRTQRLKFTSGFRALRKRMDVRLQATVRSTSHDVVVIETECHEIRLDGLPKNHARCAAETAALRDFDPTYDYTRSR
jgi:hypothetical protein